MQLYAKYTKLYMTRTLPSPPHKVFERNAQNIKILSIFNGKGHLQTDGAAMGTKMAVAFANIPCPQIEREILRQSCKKLLVFSLVEHCHRENRKIT